jgi:uncharacterized damage-inducible protein DinB
MNLQSTVGIQFSYTFAVLKMNVDGIEHQASLESPQPGGNCLNWVVGHVVAARNRILTEVLGLPSILSAEAAKPYDRGAPALVDGAAALPLGELMAIFEASQETLREGLKRVSDERLTQPAPFSPGNNPKETVGSLLAGLAFHEAYHVGQAGMLRRMLGKEGAVR